MVSPFASRRRRLLATLSAHRFRGPANIAYEVAFLVHLRDSGLHVACALGVVPPSCWLGAPA